MATNSTVSSAVGFVQVTAAPAGSVVDADGEGSAPSSGAVVSTTWMENEPFVVRLPESVAEQSTVVVPSGNRLPDAGSHATDGSGSSSASVAVATNVPSQPPVAFPSTFMSAGRSSAGAALAATERATWAIVEPLVPPPGDRVNATR